MLAMHGKLASKPYTKVVVVVIEWESQFPEFAAVGFLVSQN